MKALSGNTIERKDIPDVSFSLELGRIYLTLISDFQEHRGLTLSSEDLTVGLRQFDATNKFNRHSMEVDIALQNYGLWVVNKD